MRDLIQNLRRLVVEETAFALVVLLAVAALIGVQLFAGLPLEAVLGLGALFLATALAEFRLGRRR